MLYITCEYAEDYDPKRVTDIVRSLARKGGAATTAAVARALQKSPRTAEMALIRAAGLGWVREVPSRGWTPGGPILYAEDTLYDAF